jgi:hypothetical protein
LTCDESGVENKMMTGNKLEIMMVLIDKMRKVKNEYNEVSPFNSNSFLSLVGSRIPEFFFLVNQVGTGVCPGMVNKLERLVSDTNSSVQLKCYINSTNSSKNCLIICFLGDYDRFENSRIRFPPKNMNKTKNDSIKSIGGFLFLWSPLVKCIPSEVVLYV